ncbi:MAG: DUF1292 domain-containing protein [Chloroflexi bacterium]|nr:MAG: DUF1292 domain-containing protein [Chloroflexota bacterium]
MSGSEQVSLIDEAGVERSFVLHDAFDVDGVAYYLVEDANDAERVLLLRESSSGLETVDGPELESVMRALEEDKVE